MAVHHSYRLPKRGPSWGIRSSRRRQFNRSSRRRQFNRSSRGWTSRWRQRYRTWWAGWAPWRWRSSTAPTSSNLRDPHLQISRLRLHRPLSFYFSSSRHRGITLPSQRHGWSKIWPRHRHLQSFKSNRPSPRRFANRAYYIPRYVAWEGTR